MSLKDKLNRLERAAQPLRPEKYVTLYKGKDYTDNDELDEIKAKYLLEYPDHHITFILVNYNRPAPNPLPEEPFS